MMMNWCMYEHFEDQDHSATILNFTFFLQAIYHRIQEQIREKT